MRWILAVPVFLSAASAYAQDEIVGVRLREWFVKLDGHIESDSDTVNASPIDVDSTLGLDDQEVAHEVQAYLSIPILGKIYGGSWWVSFEGDNTLTQDISYAGETFTASTVIHTELDLRCYYATYEFSLPTIPLGLLSVEVGILAGIRIIEGRGAISGGGFSADDEGIVGTPVVGTHVAVGILDWLRADVELMGLTYRSGDRTGRYIEGYGEIVVQPLPWIFGGVGYKHVELTAKDDSGSINWEADLKLAGFYLTVGVRF